MATNIKPNANKTAISNTPNSNPDYYTIYTTNKRIINLTTVKNTGQLIILITNGIIQNNDYISGPVISGSNYNYTIKQYCTFNIKINSLVISNNCNPTIKDLFLITEQNKFIFIKLLPINNYYSYKIIQEPKHGKLIKNKNGDYIYEPNKNYTGKDLFTYQYYIKNTCVISNILAVTIKIE